MLRRGETSSFPKSKGIAREDDFGFATLLLEGTKAAADIRRNRWIKAQSVVAECDSLSGGKVVRDFPATWRPRPFGELTT